jgi:hypothetical protein
MSASLRKGQVALRYPSFSVLVADGSKMTKPFQYLNNKRKYLCYDYLSVLQCFLASDPLQSCEASAVNVSARRWAEAGLGVEF